MLLFCVQIVNLQVASLELPTVDHNIS